MGPIFPTFLNRPALRPSGYTPLTAACLSTFLLTLANPITILSFVLIFGAVGLTPASGTHLQAAQLVAGVFAGSALWWLTLSAIVSVFRRRFKPVALVWVNRIAGMALVGFGVVALLLVIE